MDEASLGLVTVLHALTMAASYRALGMHERATFSLFWKLPERRAFLVAAGLEEALRRLEHFGFDERAVEYLVGARHLRREDAEAIARTRFTGDVRAVREGDAREMRAKRAVARSCDHQVTSFSSR